MTKKAMMTTNLTYLATDNFTGAGKKGEGIGSGVLYKICMGYLVIDSISVGGVYRQGGMVMQAIRACSVEKERPLL